MLAKSMSSYLIVNGTLSAYNQESYRNEKGFLEGIGHQVTTKETFGHDYYSVFKLIFPPLFVCNHKTTQR